MKYLNILAFAALFQFTVAVGCTKQDNATQTPQPPEKALSFLALGDSYTIGESVAAEQRFPAQTVSLLKNKGIEFATPQYVARTGWTTADLQNAINGSNLAAQYDVVTLLIGVNDQYQGMDTSGYKTRFAQLLQKAIQLSGNRINHVFVLSIPDYGVTPFGGGSARISKEIDDFNAINKRITQSYNVAYIDITPISKQAATDQSFTAKDGLHPSEKQYQQWAVKLSEAVELAH